MSKGSIKTIHRGFWSLFCIIVCIIERQSHWVLRIMTVKGGTTQACAACKYQRRKCSSECPLALYFPPDQPKLFQNVHRLYGVRSILKILGQLDPSQKIEAMQSIIFESNMRDKSPIHGCYGIILYFQYLLHYVEVELYTVRTKLAICKRLNLSCSSSNEAHSFLHQNHLDAIETGISFVPHHLHSFFNVNENAVYNKSLNISPSSPLSNEAHSFFHQNHSHSHQPLNPMEDGISLAPYVNDNADYNKTDDYDSSETYFQFLAKSTFPLQQKTPQDFHENHALVDVMDDRQSFIHSLADYELRIINERQDRIINERQETIDWPINRVQNNE